MNPGNSISAISYISLGTNRGDREKNVSRAVELLQSDPLCSVIAKSSVYETKPYGNVNQDNFLNAVIAVQSDYWLKALFRLLKLVEEKLGRKKREKWGPREIDLDLLFYNKTIYSDHELRIPHEGIMKRDFVIVPLSEIAPDFVIPEKGIKVSQIDLQKIEKYIIKKSDYNL